MAKKRKRVFFDGATSDASDGLEEDEFFLSGNSSAAEEFIHCSNDRLFDSDVSIIFLYNLKKMLFVFCYFLESMSCFYVT